MEGTADEEEEEEGSRELRVDAEELRLCIV